MDLRHGTEDDLPTEYQIFCAAQGTVARRAGIDWQPPPYDSWQEVHSYIMNTAGGWNLIMQHDETTIGYCSAVQKNNIWFLSALFIIPEAQGQGVGSTLLKACWPDPGVIRATISESFQLISTGLYSRLGLTSIVPLLSLGGQPHPLIPFDRLLPSSVAELPDITSRAYGFDRSDEYAFWKATLKQTVWCCDDLPVAVSFADKDGNIGPLMGLSSSDAAAALQTQLSGVATHCSLLIPATSRDLLDAALASGLSYTRPPGLLLSSCALPLSNALALGGYWLM